MNSGTIDPTAIKQGLNSGGFYARPFRLPGESVIFNTLPLDKVFCDVCGSARPTQQCEGPSLEIMHGKRRGVATLWILCDLCAAAAAACDVSDLAQRAEIKLLAKGIFGNKARIREITIERLANMDVQTMAPFAAGSIDYSFGRRDGLMAGSLGESADSDAHAFFSAVSVAQIHGARSEFRSRYGFSIPTVEALDAITNVSANGVVDFGAGNGYWSYLLRKRGLNVLAIDNRPIANGGNRYYQGQYPGISQAAWTKIDTGSFEALRDYAGTLFLSWPPPNDMALTAARRFAGDTLVYIGERSGGITGGERFHRSLIADWSQVGHPLRIPTLYGYYDDLRIFKRR